MTIWHELKILTPVCTIAIREIVGLVGEASGAAAAAEVGCEVVVPLLRWEPLLDLSPTLERSLKRITIKREAVRIHV